MPLTSLNLSAILKWELDDLIPGFAARVQADPGQAFSLSGIDLTKYNQLRADNYSIPVGASFDFDLWSFTSLNNVLTGFTLQGVIALFVKPLIGNISIGPSSGNGLAWPFSAAENFKAGGVSISSLPPAGPAQPVTAVSRNIRITNTDAVVATGYFIAIGG